MLTFQLRVEKQSATRYALLVQLNCKKCRTSYLNPSPQKINEFKSIILNYEKIRRPHFSQDQNYLARVATDFEEQCRVIKDYGIPTIAADPAFYAEDLGVEDLILKEFKLI